MNNLIEDVPAYQSPEIIEIIKKLSLEERAVKLFNLINFTRDLQINGIQLRNPALSTDEVYKKFKEEMIKFYNNKSLNE